jgi:predicted 3-demethylubiquinone-9 3-methyltransferase (glyoxalase superfamily)
MVGRAFRFTNAVSLVVNCDSQEEIDYFWENLAADAGEQIECGWLKGKFGKYAA